MKIKNPKVPIQPCRLIQPLLEPFKHNLSQNSPIKRLFHPTLGPLRSKSALGNWTVLALIKGAKLDLQKRTIFYSSKRRPLFLGLKQIFLIYSVLENNHKTFLSGLPQPRKRCLLAQRDPLFCDKILFQVQEFYRQSLFTRKRILLVICKHQLILVAWHANHRTRNAEDVALHSTNGKYSQESLVGSYCSKGAADGHCL